MDEVIRTSTQKAVPKMVLVALASFASDDGVCWPGRVTLAGRAGVSLAALKRALKTLMKAGELNIETLGAGRSSSVYRILRGVRENPQRGQKEPSAGSEKTLRGLRENPQRVQKEPAEGSERAPNLSVNQSLNTITESPAVWEELRIKIGTMFGRKPESAWSKAEMIALGPVAVSGTSEEDLEILRRYYRSSQIPGERDYRRKTVGNLLDNWQGELDRARGWDREEKRKRRSIL